MNHKFLFTDIFPCPHGPLTAEYQNNPPSVPICNMLGHFDNFNLRDFFVWDKRNLVADDAKKFIMYFIHMPEKIELEFSQEIVDEVNNNPKSYLVLLSMLERILTPEDLVDALDKKGIRKDKVIVLCSDKQSHNKRLGGVLYLYIEFWESYTRYHQHFLKGSTELSIEERAKSIKKASKKFLCLNRNVKSHRIWFYYLMLRKDIANQGHVSFHLPRVSKPEYLWLANDYLTTKYIPQELHTEYKKDLKRKLLPKVLDKISNQWIINYNDSIKPYYQDSLFSIVTESDFRYTFITEKTYKAIAHCHPFFILGTKEHHRMLQENGYYTFEDFFGVEEVANWQDAEKLLDNINAMSMSEIKNKVKDLLPKLEHNYNNFYNRKTDWNDIRMMLEMVTN